MHGEDQSTVEAASASTPVARAAFGLARLFGVASSLLVLAMLALVATAITKRYVFGQPIPWADDLLGYMVAAMVGFGMAEALRRGDHIAIDILSSRFGGRFATLRNAWSAISVLAFAILLAWSSYVQITFSADFGAYTPGEIEIPSWIPMVPLLVGWIVLALAALGQLISTLTPRADR